MAQVKGGCLAMEQLPKDMCRYVTSLPIANSTALSWGGSAPLGQHGSASLIHAIWASWLLPEVLPVKGIWHALDCFSCNSRSLLLKLRIFSSCCLLSTSALETETQCSSQEKQRKTMTTTETLQNLPHYIVPKILLKTEAAPLYCCKLGFNL